MNYDPRFREVKMLIGQAWKKWRLISMIACIFLFFSRHITVFVLYLAFGSNAEFLSGRFCIPKRYDDCRSFFLFPNLQRRDDTGSSISSIVPILKTGDLSFTHTSTNNPQPGTGVITISLHQKCHFWICFED